jgi:hypothetical protein
MSVNNVEIYQVEKHMETATASLLSGVCTNIYKSRQNRDLASSRVELKAILGENVEHRKIFPQNGGPAQEAFDAWTAAIEITIATNRSVDADVDNHSMLLGAVRARLTNRYLLANFTHPIIAITDIRDSGTLDSFVDENDIDISVLSFYTLVNIKPNAWLE